MDIFPNITFDLMHNRDSRCALKSASELDRLERSKNEANTVRQTVWALNCFVICLLLGNSPLSGDLFLLAEANLFIYMIK